MVIEFLCPNGHRLSSPENNAGRPGRCPKCKAVFRVPQHSGKQASPSESSHSLPHLQEFESLSGRASTTSLGFNIAASSSSTTHSQNPQDLIVFLCPQGHKLNAPASMQGKPGQCPHCSGKFIVPSPEADDASEEAESPAATPTAQKTGAGESKIHDSGTIDIDLDFDTPSPASTSASAPASGSSSLSSASYAAASLGSGAYSGLTSHSAPTPAGPQAAVVPSASHSLAVPPQASSQGMSQVFATLWEQRHLSRVVEVVTLDGGKFVCTHFEARSQQQPVGIFAGPDENGSLTIHAVAWTSITRVALRGMQELPEEIFS